MLFYLEIVVDIADDPKYQSKHQDKAAAKSSGGEVLPPQSSYCHDGGDDEHEPAHGGGALFGHMPGGADLLDGLPGLHAPQHGNHGLSRQCGHHKSDQAADDDPQHLFCNLQSLSQPIFVRVNGPTWYFITDCPLFPLYKCNKLPALFCEKGGDFLPLVQMVFHAVDLLIGLVSLARQHHRVSGPGQGQG